MPNGTYKRIKKFSDTLPLKILKLKELKKFKDSMQCLGSVPLCLWQRLQEMTMFYCSFSCLRSSAGQESAIVAVGGKALRSSSWEEDVQGGQGDQQHQQQHK